MAGISTAIVLAYFAGDVAVFAVQISFFATDATTDTTTDTKYQGLLNSFVRSVMQKVQANQSRV